MTVFCIANENADVILQLEKHMPDKHFAERRKCLSFYTLIKSTVPKSPNVQTGSEEKKKSNGVITRRSILKFISVHHRLKREAFHEKKRLRICKIQLYFTEYRQRSEKSPLFATPQSGGVANKSNPRIGKSRETSQYEYQHVYPGSASRHQGATHHF